jgi:hypothetical protein
MDLLATRPTATFRLFFRTRSGEGGYSCGSCGTRHHDIFMRLSHLASLVATHLRFCRAVVQHRPVEGSAIIDGVMHAVVLRDGLLVVALGTVFEAARPAIRALI